MSQKISQAPAKLTNVFPTAVEILTNDLSLPVDKKEKAFEYIPEVQAYWWIPYATNDVLPTLLNDRAKFVLTGSPKGNVADMLRKGYIVSRMGKVFADVYSSSLKPGDLLTWKYQALPRVYTDVSEYEPIILQSLFSREKYLGARNYTDPQPFQENFDKYLEAHYSSQANTLNVFVDAVFLSGFFSTVWFTDDYLQKMLQDGTNANWDDQYQKTVKEFFKQDSKLRKQIYDVGSDLRSSLKRNVTFNPQLEKSFNLDWKGIGKRKTKAPALSTTDSSDKAKVKEYFKKLYTSQTEPNKDSPTDQNNRYLSIRALTNKLLAEIKMMMEIERSENWMGHDYSKTKDKQVVRIPMKFSSYDEIVVLGSPFDIQDMEIGTSSVGPNGNDPLVSIKGLKEKGVTFLPLFGVPPGHLMVIHKNVFRMFDIDVISGSQYFPNLLVEAQAINKIIRPCMFRMYPGCIISPIMYHPHISDWDYLDRVILQD